MKFDWHDFRDAALEVAEVADAWRLAPRAFVLFYLYELRNITSWFMALPTPVDNAHAAFAAAVWGYLVPILGWYMSTGRRWDK